MAVYTPVSITNYNSSPPPDDGSTGVDNQLSWSKHKTKLGDPLKSAIESINTNVSAAFTTNSKPLISFTHQILTTSSSIRSATYVDSGWSVTHNKSSATSNLYIFTNFNAATFTDWSSVTSYSSYIRLANTSGTLIGGTTNDLEIFRWRDSVGSGLTTNDLIVGYSRVFKVTAANCPDGTSGNNTFDIWSKQTNAGDGGTTFINGTFFVLEVEE